MKINNFQRVKNNNRVKISADLEWEDCERPAQNIFIEFEEQYASQLTDNANAFFTATAIPAYHFGEQRLFIEEEVCPELKIGLETILDWFRFWYQEDRDKLKMEVKLQKKPQQVNNTRNAAFFFSGGIDSYTALCKNHKYFDVEHPWRIRDGIVIFGLEVEEEEKFEYVLQMLRSVADTFNITLIPVFTNIYLNYRREDSKNGFHFWENKFHSAALTSAAHALDKRIHVVYVGSTHNIPNLFPLGTHPVLEPNYSSSMLNVRFDSVNLSRFEKTKLVAEWENAIQNLRVCNSCDKYENGRLNCGRCNKCVRTMLALEALGKLSSNTSFQKNHIDEEMVLHANRSLDEITYRYLGELIEPLRIRGREDLSHILEKQLKDYLKNRGKESRLKLFHQRLKRKIKRMIK